MDFKDEVDVKRFKAICKHIGLENVQELEELLTKGHPLHMKQNNIEMMVDPCTTGAKGVW